MPRRKPNTVIENRNTLGTLERKLEADRIGAEYAQAVATGVSGIAQAVGGIGIGAGILLGAVFFKGEIDEALQALKNFLPSTNPIGGGPVGSPEWLASWGDQPSDVVAQDNLDPYDETAVDQLVNERGQTLAGQSPFEAYRNGAVGRDAEYIYRIQTETLSMTPAQVANYMNYPTSQPPPLSQSMDGYAFQLAIRETVARNRILWRTWTLGLSIWWDWRTVANDVAGYISDPMLDWAACATYHYSNQLISVSDKRRGAELIEFFMNWQP